MVDFLNTWAAAFLPLVHPIQMCVGVFVAIFSASKYGMTGLILATSAVLYYFGVDPEIVPGLYRDINGEVSENRMYIPVIYAFFSLMFLFLHATGLGIRDKHFKPGAKGAPIQIKLLFLLTICHAVQFWNVAEPPFGFKPSFVPYFAALVYTPLIVLINLLMAVFLFNGVKDGIRKGWAFMDRLLSGKRSFDPGHNLNKEG